MTEQIPEIEINHTIKKFFKHVNPTKTNQLNYLPLNPKLSKCLNYHAWFGRESNPDLYKLYLLSHAVGLY